MKALEDVGCLERVGDPEYPCLDLTCFGTNVMNGTEKVRLTLPETGIPASRGTATGHGAKHPVHVADAPADLDLYDRLRLIRTGLAEKRHVPVYCILSNDALAGLAEAKPETPDEALEIRGIGMAKLTTIIPPFLKEIAKWKTENTVKF